MYAVVKVDGDRHSQVRWRFLRGYDIPRLMGKKRHRSFPGGIYFLTISSELSSCINLYDVSLLYWGNIIHLQFLFIEYLCMYIYMSLLYWAA